MSVCRAAVRRGPTARHASRGASVPRDADARGRGGVTLGSDASARDAASLVAPSARRLAAHVRVPGQDRA
jgi:hypothetical protein